MFEFLFNFSREVLDKGELILASDWPRWALVASFLILGLAMTGVLAQQRRRLKFGQLAVIWLLQLSMLGLVTLLVWQPALRTEQLRAGENVVALMLDTSRSMAYGEENLSRIQHAGSRLTSELLPRLRNEYKIQHFFFSANAEPVNSLDPLPAPGAQTRLGDSLLGVLRRARTVPLAAIILVSDGADNAGALSRAQLKDIGAFRVPVHTVGVGRERIPEDLELAEVVLPDKALPGTRLSARVTIRHDREGQANVKIYDGDKILAAHAVKLSAETTSTVAWIDFVVAEPGQRDLRVSLQSIAGERNLRNNSRNHVIDIPNDSYRILYIEGEPRWEYKFLRRALDTDPTVRLTSLLRVSANKFYRQGIDSPEELEQGFPSDKASLFDYEALIIGSIEAATFTREQQAMIRDFVSVRGGSLLMLAGPDGLGAGGWGNSAISEVLPTRLPDADAVFRRDKVPVRLTDLGRETPMLQFSEEPEKNLRLWQELPEIANYQNIGASRPAALTLLNIAVAGKEQPLLVTQPYGRGQSYILATAGTWRWQMSLPSDDQRHEIFWRQLARELVANSPQRFQLSSRNDGEKVLLQAELRGETFEPLNDLAVTAVVSPKSGESMIVQLRPSTGQPGLLEGEFTPGNSGLHVIEAISYGSDNEPDAIARIAIRHDTNQNEFYSLRQNRPLLEQLAAETGGRYWTLAQLDGLPEAIRYSSAGITEQHIRPLWDAPAVFLLLLILKFMEWGLRRRWRTI